MIEVMIALIFFSFIGIVLQSVTASTVNQYSVIRDKTFASWIAQNKMAELRIEKKLPSPKEYKEDLDYADLKWQVVSKVQGTQNPDIHRVTVIVNLKGDIGDSLRQKFELTGFIGRY